MDYTGLIIGCPKQNEDPECPFKTYREMPLYYAFKDWKKMRIDIKKELINKHLNCPKTR